MKRRKILITAFLLAACVALSSSCFFDCSCTRRGSVSHSSGASTSSSGGGYVDMPSIAGWRFSDDGKSAICTVGYDYGNYRKDKVTLLLSGSLPFFDFGTYGLSALVAGDELTVYYEGEFFIEETYPSQVQIDGNIVKVEKSNYTYIIQNCYKKGDGIESQFGVGFINLPKYVINRDESFTALSALADGTEIFVAHAISASTPEVDYNIDGQRIPPAALYSYRPIE